MRAIRTILCLSLALAGPAALAHAPAQHEPADSKGTPQGRMQAVIRAADAKPQQASQMQQSADRPPFCVRSSAGTVNCLYFPGSKH